MELHSRMQSNVSADIDRVADEVVKLIRERVRPIALQAEWGAHELLEIFRYGVHIDINLKELLEGKLRATITPVDPPDKGQA